MNVGVLASTGDITLHCTLVALQWTIALDDYNASMYSDYPLRTLGYSDGYNARVDITNTSDLGGIPTAPD